MSDTSHRLPANTALTPAQAAARELLDREAALASLDAFVRYLRLRGVESRYFAHDPHPCQRPLIEAAEALVLRGEKAVTISCPPSFSKSTVFSIWLPTWALARNAHLRVLWCSHTDSLVQDFARERRKIFNSPAWQSLAGASLTDANMAADTLEFTAGGKLTSRSASASVTGYRSDLIIGDDLVSGAAESRSRPMLDSLWQWLRDDFLTRRDGEASAFAIIGTRWSVSDPIGRLVGLTAAGTINCNHVRIAAVCDDEAHDPLGRRNGEWIDWPGRFDDEQQRRLWQSNPFSWSTLFQQTPFDRAEGFCSYEDIAFVQQRPAVASIILGGDFAATDSSAADFTAFAVCAVTLDHYGARCITVLDLWREQRNARDVAEAFAGIVATYRPQVFVCERDGISRVHLDGSIPAAVARRNGRMPYVKLLPAAGASKEVKNSPLRGLLQQRKVYFLEAGWNAQAVSEIVRFPGGDNDDIVDAIGAVARILDKVPLASPPPAPKSRIESTSIVMIDGVPHYAKPFDEMSDDRIFDKRRRNPARIEM